MKKILEEHHKTAGVIRAPRAAWLPGNRDGSRSDWPRFLLVLAALLLAGAALAYFWPHS